MSDLQMALLRYLGGQKAVGIRDPHKPLAFHKLVLEGIPARCVAYFKVNTGFSNVVVSELLGVSEKTFIRWQEHPQKPLDSVSSDRLLRSAKIIAMAEEVLESREEAKSWLVEPQASLGNAKPRDLLTTDNGAKQVEDLLLQMEYGYLA